MTPGQGYIYVRCFRYLESLDLFVSGASHLEWREIVSLLSPPASRHGSCIPLYPSPQLLPLPLLPLGEKCLH